MLNIKFIIFSDESDDKDKSLSGFELGDIEIQVDGKLYTSANRHPNQSMMIFITASDLLLELVSFYKGKSEQLDFIGCDSSFKLTFIKKTDTIIAILLGDEIIMESISRYDLLSSTLQSVRILMGKYVDKISNEGISKDLHLGIDTAGKYLKEI